MPENIPSLLELVEFGLEWEEEIAAWYNKYG
jgi:hypothetical protein